MRAFRRTSVLVAVVVTAAALAPAAAHATASSPPTVAIIAPTAGASVPNLLTVTAVATIDSVNGDVGEDLLLSVDGAYPTAPPVACPTGDPSSCTGTWQVETSDWSLGQHTLQAAVESSGWVVGSSVVDVVVPVRPPIARILFPADGTTITPNVQTPSVPGIAAALTLQVVGAQPGAASGTPASWQLVVDGTAAGHPVACSANWITTGCAISLPWRDGPAGVHRLVARFTVGTTVVDSSPITVTVIRPTVAITSPADGSLFSPTTSIVATGAVVAPSDSPVSMSLLVNGIAQQRRNCPANLAAPGTCTVTFTWFGPLPTSAAALSVILTTTQSYGTSAPVTVMPYLQTRLTLGDDGRGTAGTRQTVHGWIRTVLPPGTALPAGIPVTLRFFPAVGRVTTLYAVTDDSGNFAVTYRPRSNTTVTASVAGGPTYAAASTIVALPVLALPHCDVPRRLARGTVSLVRCTVPDLPDGVKVSLQFLAHKHWYALRSAFARHGVVTLPLHWDRKGSLDVRVVVGGSRVYVTTWGKPVLLKVF